MLPLNPVCSQKLTFKGNQITKKQEINRLATKNRSTKCNFAFFEPTQGLHKPPLTGKIWLWMEDILKRNQFNYLQFSQSSLVNKSRE